MKEFNKFVNHEKFGLKWNFKNRNDRKGMFQKKETREMIILIYYTENATLKQT